MTIAKPTKEQLKKIAANFKLDLTEEELTTFEALIGNNLASYERVQQLAGSAKSLPVKYSRTTGYRPPTEENKYNAWYQKTSIKGSNTGKLLNKKIVLKDNVSLAGVSMMNGSSIVEGYIPDEDATIVTRILDAGGEIVGKAVCEDLCLSGGSHTSATGPVLNPHDKTRSSGGSSSGSAVLVTVGEADMAIGCDQGGSIRIPSSWCGIYGLKPSFGLVPYTGIFPIEQTLDHTGPMARTVEDVALLLEVIAGVDGMDPRQSGLEAKNYTNCLDGNAKGLKIGIVEEGFGWEGLSEDDVDEMVLEAAYKLEQCGAKVEKVSIPLHRDAVHIWNVIGTDGLTALMVNGNGFGTNWKGYYSTKLQNYYGQARKERANDFSETVKLTMLHGQYMQDQYQGKYYGLAQNLSFKLKEAYDEVFKQYDILIMPTTPMKAAKIPGNEASLEEYIVKALNMITNTSAFDVTGHPAMNVPCGNSNGLPVGLMMVGRYGEDEIVLKAAHAFEKLGLYSLEGNAAKVTVTTI